MAINLLVGIALVVGIYILYKADKHKDSLPKAAYLVAGLIVTLWSLAMWFNSYAITLLSLPLVAGLFTVASMHTKGLTQAIAGIIAFVLFVSMF
jgi:uncharacterized membrane protein